MESFEHQEERSRQELNGAAVLKTAFTTGLIFFVMSGGTPWSSAGAANAVMGRQINASLIVLLVGHFTVALLYTYIIASAIYRFTTGLAVVTGVAIGIGLYLVNWGLFKSAGGVQSREFIVFFVHLLFSLFASGIYKAISVPKPRR